MGAGCGDDPKGLECGLGTVESSGECVPLDCVDGTFELNGQCVPIDPNDATAPTTSATPPGGRSRDAVPGNVVLTTDEPATIFFTRDGSEPTSSSPSEPSPVTVTDIVDGETIKYFAIDPAGNEETVQSQLYVQDVEGPDRVTDFAAALTAAAVGLSWVNPADAEFGGVVVVASNAGEITSAPEAGTFYSAGDTLTGGETVIVAGDEMSAADTLTIIGERRVYSAWSYDDLGNYSSARLSNDVVLPLPAQAGTLSIDLVNDVVTVSSDPANLTLTATSNYDEGSDVLTVNLTVQNDAPRLLFNVKALTTALNSGTQAGPSFSGSPMTFYGPNAMDLAGTVTRAITITGVDGSVDPVVMDFDFLDSPMLINSNSVADSSGGGGAFSTNMLSNRMRGMAVSHSGRFAYVGEKDSAGLRVMDTVTLSTIQSATLAQGRSSVGGVAVSRMGDTVYALVNTGSDYNGGDGNTDNDGSFDLGTGEVDLLALDPTTLEETARVRIHSGTRGMTGRGVFISPSGDRAFVATSRKCNAGGTTTCADATPVGMTQNELWLVDLQAMQLLDTDASAEGVQPVVATSAVGTIEHCAWRPDETEFFASFNNLNIGQNTGGDENAASAVPPVNRIDMSTFAVTSLAATEAGIAGGGLIATNSKLYYSSRGRNLAPTNIFTVFALADGAESNPDLSFTTGDLRGTAGVVFDPTGTRYFVPVNFRNSQGGIEMAVFDTATDTRIDMDGEAGNGITNMLMRSKPHGLAITPF